MIEQRRIPEEDLIPQQVETVVIGENTYEIKPIPYGYIPALVLLLKPAVDEFKKRNINFDNAGQKIPEITSVIVRYAPPVVALLSNFNILDLNRLPFEKRIEIARKSVGINVTAVTAFGVNAPEIIDAIDEIMTWFTTVCNG